MNKIDYRDLAFKIFCFGSLALVVIFAVRYALGYVAPFIVAWGIAYLVYPIACELSKGIRIPRKICSFVLVLLMVIIISSILFLIGNRLLYELQKLLNMIRDNEEGIAEAVKNFFAFFNSWGEKIPIVNKLQNTEIAESIKENINGFVMGMWQSFVEKFGSAVPDIATSIVTALPNALFVILITVIACFYFAIDIDLLHSNLKKLLPSWITEYLRIFVKRIKIGFQKYVKAYLIIFAITSVELLVGFLILGIDYAFVLSVLIAIIDFLPVLGTGVVLVPWGIVLLVLGNTFKGVGILILFVLMTVVRQVIEPKIVGNSLGVHPLITLISIYIGYKLLGIIGMIFLPIGILIFFSKDEEQTKESAKRS